MKNSEKNTDEWIEPPEAPLAEEVTQGIAVAMNAIPYGGGVLAGIVQSVISRRQNRRLNDFLNRLVKEVQGIKDQLNEEFMKSEDFGDLAEEIITKAADTRQAEKLDAFRAIFLNSILSDHPDYNEISEIADLITRWQPRHTIMLKILFNPRNADQQMGIVIGDQETAFSSIRGLLKKLLPEWTDDQIERTWKDLYDANIHATPGIKTMMTGRGISQLENRLTEFGMRLASFIRNPVSEE